MTELPADWALLSRGESLGKAFDDLREAGLVDVFGGDALQFGVGHVREVVVAVFRRLEDQQDRTVLAAVELANHALGRGFEEPRRHDAADARPGAGDDKPVAAVDALALLARQLVGHLQRRFATGAINLHGNETPGLASERYRKGGERGANAKRQTHGRKRPLIQSTHGQSLGKRVGRDGALLDDHAADRQVVGIAGLVKDFSRVGLVWPRDFFVGLGVENQLGEVDAAGAAFFPVEAGGVQAGRAK